MINNNQLDKLFELAISAGDAILKIYNSDVFGIQIKSDNSPLTIADKASNDIICQGLEKVFPEIPIISEEVKSRPYSERKTYSICWLIDPLDGTKEFIKRNGEFTVNIALIQNQEPILGVIYVPVTDELYYAQKNKGAFKIINGVHHALKSNIFSLQKKGVKVVASRSHLNKETQIILEKLKYPETLSIGSSLKFMMLAEGKADFYPRLAPTMEWDTAAAQIILSESGGSVINPCTLSPLQYNKEDLLNPFFIATANMEQSFDTMINLISKDEEE